MDADRSRLTLLRRYPTVVPDDDDFHDEVLSDRWWETETCWFSWNIPERGMGGWMYCQARPNARLCNGGAWVWDASGAYPWELLFHLNYSGLELPPRADRNLRDFEWPNGVHVKALEPLQRYAVAFHEPGALEVEIEFEALMPPNSHPEGVAPFLNSRHFDQPGHVRGEMVLHGEHITIDCLAVRDRSWGPRPLGRPRRRSAAGTDTRTGTPGVGYSHATASGDDAWLVFSTPGPDDDPVACGYLVQHGEFGHILGGERRLHVDPVTGWPTAIEIEAIDDRGRRLEASGRAVSRHWKGHGGDSLMHWTWAGIDAWGEDQTYLSTAVWQRYRDKRATQ